MNRTKASLLKKIHGGQVCQIISTAARLKICDYFDTNELSLADLSEASHLDQNLLERFLKALTYLKIIETTQPQHYKLTEEGELLKSNSSSSLAPIAAYKGSPMVWKAMGKLYDGITQNTNPFELAHNSSLFEYLDNSPTDFALFHDAMHFYELNSSKTLLDKYDFSPLASLLDVGCGMATFLNAIVERAPHIKGAGFDLPKVIAKAKHHTPCPLIEGDFFNDIPTGYNAYLLRNILHDWSDDKCLTILKKIKKPHSKLLILETVLDDDPHSRMGRFSDLTMFMLTNNGKERTYSEFKILLERAGFTISNIVTCSNTSKTLIEAHSDESKPACHP